MQPQRPRPYLRRDLVPRAGKGDDRLPPPIGNPAIAIFKVIALASFVTSVAASQTIQCSVALVPPAAGPSAVECTPMNSRWSGS